MRKSNVIKSDTTFINNELLSTFFVDYGVNSIKNDSHFMRIAEDTGKVLKDTTNIPKIHQNGLRELEYENDGGDWEGHNGGTNHNEGNHNKVDQKKDGIENHITMDGGTHRIFAGGQRFSLELGVASTFVVFLSIGFDRNDVSNGVCKLSSLLILSGSFFFVAFTNTFKTS